ncbi:MAG: cupredoxin domain-containing protein [Gaiellaceae bacterium]
MKRIAIVAALAALTVAAGTAAAAAPKLTASVADPFKISFTVGGKKVSKLKAGFYTIVVEDTAADHNFHLTGPGVNKLTSVKGKGTFTWKVTLKKGTYAYVCDPHSSFMSGSFTVT